jgi:hypothetical protein
LFGRDRFEPRHLHSPTGEQVEDRFRKAMPACLALSSQMKDAGDGSAIMHYQPPR